MESGFTIFDFGKKYMVFFDGDNVDFIEEGFVVAIYNSVAVSY